MKETNVSEMNGIALSTVVIIKFYAACRTWELSDFSTHLFNPHNPRKQLKLIWSNAIEGEFTYNKRIINNNKEAKFRELQIEWFNMILVRRCVSELGYQNYLDARARRNHTQIG